MKSDFPPKTPASILDRHQRQVHLDFHTSPHIPGVAADFAAVDFAATLKRAHVNRVTVFAKCHHGMSDFPTQVGTTQPELPAAGRVSLST